MFLLFWRTKTINTDDDDDNDDERVMGQRVSDLRFAVKNPQETLMRAIHGAGARCYSDKRTEAGRTRPLSR